MKAFATLTIFVILATGVNAMCTTINFNNFNQFQPIGNYHSHGLMYWDSNWTFNGQYTIPSDYYRQLSSDVNLYTERTYSHDLFIQVKDVVGGHFGYATGGTFEALTMVGVEISSHDLSNITPFYSGLFANPGESLMGTPTGNCGDSVNVPLTSTPGWGLASANSGTFVVQTVDTTGNNGFTGPWGCIWGGHRILNGGVFMLDFGKSLGDLRANDFNVSVIYGYNSETFRALPTAPTPEPSTLAMLGLGLVGTAGVIRRKCSRS